ncbi:serine/threonine-protein phosphatase 6 regulatory subunit 3-like protein [Tanacetum coccineum]
MLIIGHGSLERDDEVCVSFSLASVCHDMMSYCKEKDYKKCGIVISSLRLGDDQESGLLFTNSNWFAFKEERAAHEQSISAVALPSPNTKGTAEAIEGDDDKVTSNENAKDLVDSAIFKVPKESVEPEPSTEPSIEKSVVTSKPAKASQAATDSLPNGNLEANLVTDIGSDALSIKEVDPAPSKKKRASRHLPPLTNQRRWRRLAAKL